MDYPTDFEVPKQLYHGTDVADDIYTKGFQLSIAGFGQRGLTGVGLTPDKDEAIAYARGKIKWGRGGVPEVISVELKNVKLIDLRGCVHNADIWKKIGFDWEIPKELEYIVNSNRQNVFAITDELVKRNYDGAIIDNTIKKGGAPEFVIFKPEKIKIISTHHVRKESILI